MTGRLDGRVALITGGSRGIGKAEAELFAREGAHVVIGDIRTVEGERAASEIGTTARFIELDVTNEAAWDLAIRTTVAEFGRLDVLVNNAGIGVFAPLVSTSTEEFMRVVAVNQLGVFLGMRSAVPAMTANGGGSIINTSSIGGLAGTPMGTAYAASKFAVRGMTKVAALELARSGVRVNSIHPGTVLTPMVDESVRPGVDVAAMFEASIPMRRLGAAVEIAKLALFLASEDSSYCTGAEFVADGGVMAGTQMDPGDAL